LEHCISAIVVKLLTASCTAEWLLHEACSTCEYSW